MRRRRTTLAAGAVASIALLGACTSQPSPKAVVKDVIESITVPGGGPLPQAQHDCMLEVVDGMSSDELEAIGKANIDVPVSSSNTGDEDLTALIDRFADCQPSG